MASPRRVFVVDDHPMMRLGLRQFLEEAGDFMVCGEAATAAEALRDIPLKRPEVIVLDLSLAGRSGLDLLKDLRLHHPSIPVLVHSMHDEQVFAERALRAGAQGYLMKQETGVHVVQALRQVLRGETFLSDRLRSGSRGRRSGTRATRTPIASLTRREFEVFQLIGQGLSSQQIAAELGLSLKTIDAHREHMKRKLNVRGSTELNLLAVRWSATELGTG
jgi:DNA-binding NarL/FixJ family response regulator